MQAMSKNRALPAQPSLEYLRKEAKQELAQLRSRAHSAQLADAQLLLARTYGFSSWRVLKAEVQRRRDALGLPPVLMGDSFHRPRRPTGFRAAVFSPVNAEQNLFRALSVPMILASLPLTFGLGSMLLGDLVSSLLG